MVKVNEDGKSYQRRYTYLQINDPQSNFLYPAHGSSIPQWPSSMSLDHQLASVTDSSQFTYPLYRSPIQSGDTFLHVPGHSLAHSYQMISFSNTISYLPFSSEPASYSENLSMSTEIEDLPSLMTFFPLMMLTTCYRKGCQLESDAQELEARISCAGLSSMKHLQRQDLHFYASQINTTHEISKRRDLI